MKKRIKRTLTLLLGVIGLAAVAVGGVTYDITASAAAKKNHVLSQRFYDGTATDWTLHQATVKDQGTALHFSKKATYGSAVICNGLQMDEEYTKITFDMQVEEFTSASHIMVYLGGEEKTDSVTSYGVQLAIRDKSVSIAGNDGGKQYNQNRSTVNVTQSVFSAGEEISIALEVQRVENTEQYIFKVTYAVDEKEIFSSALGTKETGETTVVPTAYTLTGGYIGFDNASNISWNMKNFAAYDKAGEVLFADDFSTDQVTEPSEDIDKGNWHITGTFTKEDISASKISYLASESENAYAVHNESIANEKKTSVEQEFSMDVALSFLEEGTVVGLGLGLEEKTSALDSGSLLGIRKINDYQGQFVHIRTGKYVAYGSSFDVDGLNKWEKLHVSLGSDNTATVAFAEVEEKFGQVLYDGYWALGQKSAKENTVSKVYFDNIERYAYQAVHYKTGDVSNNFSGTKEDEFGDKSFYVNTQKYYLGPRVSLVRRVGNSSDGYINFTSAISASCFGYRDRYDEYVCEFDIVNKTAADLTSYPAFGLSFAKKTVGVRLGDEFNPAIGFLKNGTGGTSVKTYGAKLVSGSTETPLNDYNFFADQETKYNFMLIVRNRAVEVYYKKDSEPASALTVLRAKIEDVDTDGYVTVFGTNGASFRLYDYKITNLNESYRQSSALAIREQFNKESIDERLQKSGDTSISEGKITLKKNAKIVMTQEDVAYLIRLRVNKIEGNLLLSYGGNNILKINSNGEIFSVEGTAEKKLALLREVDFVSAKNMIFDVRIQGKIIQIGYRTGSEVKDREYQTLATHTLTEECEAGKFSLGTDGEAVLSRLDIFSLSDLYQAQPTDYIGNEDNATPWIPKPVLGGEPAEQDKPIENEGQSCQSSTSLFASVGLTLSAIVLATDKRRKMKKIISIALAALCSLAMLGGCNGQGSEAQKPTTYPERNEEYILGVCEKFYEYNNLMEKCLSVEYVSSLVKTMGMKTYRLGLSYALLFTVDENNEPVFNPKAKETAHKIIDSLVASGVERICVITDTHLEPYDYVANNHWVVPDPLSEKEYYLQFLQLYEKASKMIAEEFPQVHYFEPGNEPDHATGRPISKNGYVEGAGAANAPYRYSITDIAHIVSDICYYVSRGVKSVNPENTVVTPGMCNTGNSIVFLDEIYKAIKSKALPTGEEYADVDPDHYFQILSWHPYLGGYAAEMDETWVEFNKKMYEVAQKHGDGDTLVWFTEIGFSDKGNATTEKLNADRMVKALDYIRNDLPFVETACVFRLTDLETAKVSAFEDNIGLFESLSKTDGSAGKPKPIAYSLYKYFHGENADTSVLEQWMSK